jgi:hypothetical protein
MLMNKMINKNLKAQFHGAKLCVLFSLIFFLLFHVRLIFKINKIKNVNIRR